MELSTLAFLGFVRPNLYAWHQGWPFSLSHFLSFPFRVCVCVCVYLWELWGQKIPPQPAAVYLSNCGSPGQIPLQIIYGCH